MLVDKYLNGINKISDEDLENLCFDLIDEKWGFVCSVLTYSRIRRDLWQLEFEEIDKVFKGDSKHDCLSQFYEFLINLIFEEEIQKELKLEETQEKAWFYKHC